MFRLNKWIFSVFLALRLIENGIAFSEPLGKPKIIFKQIERNVNENSFLSSAVATVQVNSPATTRTQCMLKGNYRRLFRMRPLNPFFYEIFLDKPLDYEREQHVKVNVTCRAVGGDPIEFNVGEISINVVDQNDHSPMIREILVKKVQENSPVNSLVSVIKVADPDSGSNGRVFCSMSSRASDSVRLLRTSKDTFAVKTSRVFDREATPMFRYTIRCSDNGVPPLQMIYTKAIIIADMDDNMPLFIRRKYAAYVIENGPIGMQILHLRATDDDLKNIIQYELSSKELPFHIDKDTGIITTTRMLDREMTNRYAFHVLAISGARNSRRRLTGTATVSVTVLDQNDNMPAFPILRYDFKANVTQRRIGQVQASDADEGRNAEIKYGIPWVPGFSINATSGVIYRNTTLKPAARKVNFLVSAVNLGFVSKVEVSVTFLDLVNRETTTVSSLVNKTDAKPKVNQGKESSINFHYWFFVNENEPVGTKLGKIVATGAENITYHLQNKGIKWLKLDSMTGVLSTATKIDRETMKDANISVVVSYPPGNTNITRRLMVSINDINDCSPKFKTKNLTVSIPEGYHNSTIINGTSARDCDTTSPNNKVSYRIRPSEDAKFFQILEDGQLELRNGTFDRETRSSITIILEAADGGKPTRSSSMRVTTKLIDINDNAPRWMFPFSNNTIMYVRERTPPGTYVVAVVASDRDIGKNGMVVYDFVNPTPDLPFTINKKHGIIKTSRALTEKDLKSHQVNLQAKDLGTPSRQSFTTLNLIVKKMDYN